MGTYAKTAIISNNHPVYQHSNGLFLYYWPESLEWHIGGDYTLDDHLLKGSNADCPLLVESWLVLTGFEYSSSYAVTAKCAVPPTGAPATP